jgi:PilZ domain
MAELIDPRDLTTLKAMVTSYRMEAAALLSLLARKGWLSKGEGQELMKELQEHPPQKPRIAARHKLNCRVFFSSGALEGEGLVNDLSKTGCKIQCQTVPEAGATVKADLFLPDYPRPLKVERGLVRWVKADTFGLEFVDIQASQRERLRVFLGAQSSAKA